jgi:hypothetical protein
VTRNEPPGTCGPLLTIPLRRPTEVSSCGDDGALPVLTSAKAVSDPAGTTGGDEKGMEAIDRVDHGVSGAGVVVLGGVGDVVTVVGTLVVREVAVVTGATVVAGALLQPARKTAATAAAARTDREHLIYCLKTWMGADTLHVSCSCEYRRRKRR